MANVMEHIGKKEGVLVLAGDILKVIVAGILGRLLFPDPILLTSFPVECFTTNVAVNIVPYRYPKINNILLYIIHIFLLFSQTGAKNIISLSIVSFIMCRKRMYLFFRLIELNIFFLSLKLIRNRVLSIV